MRKMKQKLRSRRGASITFALLIFLVCAIISGVVIVAASTAGGRLSGMRETDQRYFAATEAARKLQEIFDGKTVEVTYTSDSATATENNAILKAASEAVIMGTGDDIIEPIGPIDGPAEDGKTSPYTCTITPRLTNGLMYFDIKAQGGSNINSGIYNLTIVFSSNVKKPKAAGGPGSAKATVTWSLNSLSEGRAAQTTGG